MKPMEPDFLSWRGHRVYVRVTGQGHPPLLLSSTLGVDDAVFEADLTNPDVLRQGHIAVERGQVNVHRSRVLWSPHCVERIRVTNFGLTRIEVPLALRFDADFADVFEVRGTRRVKRGERLSDVRGEDNYLMRYRGLDGVERRSRIRWSRQPERLVATMTATFFIMTPMMYLSGFIFPIENMPAVIQPFTYLIPLRYFIIIVRGIFLKGVGWHVLWPQVAALLAWGVVIVALAVARSRKTLN